MKGDKCGDQVAWSVTDAAAAHSTLAGVLAGFLILAATTLLVNWYYRSDAHTIALFVSGVPALTISSYLFGVLNGAKPTSQSQCDQMWSQWLPALASLFIGGAVLLCGLGWALVSYGDNLAVTLIKKNRPMATVADRRKFFIVLNGWFSFAATTAPTGLLIAANVLYLKASNVQRWKFLEFWDVKLYVMLFVFLFGFYVVFRSAYLVIWRTRAALEENDQSCRKYVPGVYNDYRTPRPKANKSAKFVGNIAVAILLLLGALLASYLTKEAVQDPFSGRATCHLIILVLIVYAVGRWGYCAIAPVKKLPKTHKKFAVADDMIRLTPSAEEPADAIRIRYPLERIAIVSHNLVLFAILATIFAAELTQGPLWPYWRVGLTLVIGGFYPAVILLGLSYAVPAGMGFDLPKWKTKPPLKYMP
jgi:hypothetical protein